MCTKFHVIKSWKLIFLCIPACVLTHCAFSQNFNANQPPDTYQSPGNPYYWKNRPPYPGYWQQDVSYKIFAQLNDSLDIIDGKLELNYTNNSPDSLHYVYFHLYQNAFQPGSYLDNLNSNNKLKTKWGKKYEAKKLGTEVSSLLISNGIREYEAQTELDNTILKVFLKSPLLPGTSINFKINFKTYFDSGSQRRRMKKFDVYGFRHYDGVHWYPRICVYDKKFGWDTYQHLGREFYGNYGTYDVQLTLPNHYIVEATGTLQNREVVMPDSLRKKLDLRNFVNKPFNSPPSLQVIPDGTQKTWHFYAENVHDFAWTADPTYRIGEATWNGIQCIAVVQESHAAGWQNAAAYSAKIIEIFSKDFGMYAYPKIVVADARDGMEYPMLTLDGGFDPIYRSLFAHEIGHNWFFGMVGNSETYRALLDEGFAQLLTAWAMDKIEGPTGEPRLFSNKYQKKFSTLYDGRHIEVYHNYLQEAIRGRDGFISTHSDMFGGLPVRGGSYSMVYRKTAAMLYNLQYVLGDSLFLKSMQHYFHQWKFCHPYPEDFRQSIIDFTKADLNWFFDQWLDTDKKIDYKISCISKTDSTDVYEIKFNRKERMQMPIDFSVYSNNGIKYDFHIPNTWFVKNTEATVLPKWYGWDKLHPSYSAFVKIPSGISDVVIDTSYRLADINMLDNRKKFPASLQFDSRIFNLPDWKKYEMFVRPDIWYNSYDGIKTGLHLEGDYMNYRHIFKFATWVNTGIVQGNFERPVDLTRFDAVSFVLNYRTPVEKIIKNTSVIFSAKALDGLNLYSGGFEYLSDNSMRRFSASFKSMQRKTTNDLEYLLYPNEWQSNFYNNTLRLAAIQKYQTGKLYGTVDASLISSTIGGDYDYAKIIFQSVNNIAVSKFDFRFRLFGQIGTGNNPANESALFLAGANPEELMDEKFTRSRGFIPNEWVGNYGAETNHFQQGGGLNLRGFAGYVVTEESGNELRYIYKGNTGFAINAELDFENFFAIQPRLTRKWLKLDMYLFADAGIINVNVPDENLRFGAMRADAGIGTAFTIKKFGPLEMVNPFTIRFDMPLVLNRPPFAEEDYFKFRWVIGISRSF